jgi:hypothetical protein
MNLWLSISARTLATLAVVALPTSSVSARRLCGNVVARRSACHAILEAGPEFGLCAAAGSCSVDARWLAAVASEVDEDLKERADSPLGWMAPADSVSQLSQRTRAADPICSATALERCVRACRLTL